MYSSARARTWESEDNNKLIASPETSAESECKRKGRNASAVDRRAFIFNSYLNHESISAEEVSRAQELSAPPTGELMASPAKRSRRAPTFVASPPEEFSVSARAGTSLSAAEKVESTVEAEVGVSMWDRLSPHGVLDIESRRSRHSNGATRQPPLRFTSSLSSSLALICVRPFDVPSIQTNRFDRKRH